MTNRIIAALLGSCMLFTTYALSAQTPVPMGSVVMPPYVNSEGRGVGIELLEMIFAQAGLEMTVEVLPAARLSVYSSTGQVAGYYPGLDTNLPDSKYLYTQPVIKSRYLIVSKQEAKVNLANMQDYTIGGMRGWGLEFAMPEQPWFLVDTNKQFINLLRIGRIDGYLEEELVGIANIRTNDGKNFAQYHLDEEFMPANFGIGIVKTIANAEQLVERLNKAIDQLNEQGLIDTKLAQFKANMIAEP